MDNKEYEAPIQRGLLKPTLQVTIFSILQVMVGLVSGIIVATKFGATIERDAYFAAVVVPIYITSVLVFSLTVSFLPVFIECETKKNKEEAWKVASIVINFIFLTLFGISLLGFIFAKQLISVTAPGFKGEELLLTTALLRIIFPPKFFSKLSSPPSHQTRIERSRLFLIHGRKESSPKSAPEEYILSVQLPLVPLPI